MCETLYDERMRVRYSLEKSCKIMDLSPNNAGLPDGICHLLAVLNGEGYKNAAKTKMPNPKHRTLNPERSEFLYSTYSDIHKMNTVLFWSKEC